MQVRKTRYRGVVMVVIVSPPKLWVWFPLMTRCTRYTICQWLLAGREFSHGTSVSSTNKTDLHDIAVKIVKSGVKHHKHNPNPNLEIRTAHSIEQGNQNRHENITKNHISYYITNLIKSRSHILSPFCFGSWRSNTSPLQLKGPSWSLSHGSLIYNYLCNQCLSQLKLWVLTPIQHYEIKLVRESWKWH